MGQWDGRKWDGWDRCNGTMGREEMGREGLVELVELVGRVGLVGLV